MGWGQSFFVLQISPFSCDLLETAWLEGAAVAFCGPLRRGHGIAVDILASMPLLSSTALQISVFDLSLVVSHKLLPQLSHSSLDSHIGNVICFFESVEEFELGIILLVFVFVQIQSASINNYLYCS